MKKHRTGRRVLTALLSLGLTLGLLCASLLPVRAVTEAALDSADLIGEREPSGSGLCLLYSSWYMARRRVAIERGLDAALAANRDSFHLAATKSLASAIVYWSYQWQAAEDLTLHFGYLSLSENPNAHDIEDLARSDGAVWELTGGSNLASGRVGSTDPTALAGVLRHFLSSHPEGVVIHCRGSGGSTHAALITGWDASAGVFLCVDPVNGGPPAPLTGSNYLFGRPPTEYASTQDGVLRHVESIWYIVNGDPQKTAAYLSGAPEEPAEPVEPDPPVITREEIPVQGTCYESAQAVDVGGETLFLSAYALRDAQGRPTNYVRLRDLAALLDGTAAQFDVLWTQEEGIRMVPGASYAHRNGAEGETPFHGEQPYSAYLQNTAVGTASLPLTAFQIMHESGGHTFYQLRDLGRALNFNVGWSAERGVYLEPGVPYTDEN